MAPSSSTQPSTSMPDVDAATVLFLEQELERAKAELAEYQVLMNEVPCIYEAKYRQELTSQLMEIRRLLEERRSLQQQLSIALQSRLENPALPAGVSAPEPEAAADPVQPRTDRPTPRRLRPWRLRRWRLGLARRFGAPARRLAQQSGLPLLTIGTATAVALLLVGADALGPRGQDSRGSSPPEVGQTEARTESQGQAKLECPLPGQ